MSVHHLAQGAEQQEMIRAGEDVVRRLRARAALAEDFALRLSQQADEIERDVRQLRRTGLCRPVIQIAYQPAFEGVSVN